MSQENNTELLELTAEHCDYWQDTTMGKVLEADLDRSDYEALAEHLKQSAKLMFEAEYQPI